MMPPAARRDELQQESEESRQTQNAPTAQRFRCACVCTSIERCKSSPGTAFSSP